MGFKNKRNVKIARNVASAPDIRPAVQAVPAGFRVGEVKNGQVAVTIYDRAITPQKAFALAKKAADQPIKLFGSMTYSETTPVSETRVYSLV